METVRFGVNVYSFANYLFIDTSDDSLGSFRVPYIIFNGFEAIIWFGCSILVLNRHLKTGKHRHEILYALAFALFGLSDVIETSGTSLLLILFKAACLLALATLRKQAMVAHGSTYL